MRVLVTGHCGYIGSVLVPLLLARGHHVSGLDTGLFEDCRFSDTTESIPTLRKDVRDVTEADIRGNDAVIHLAGLSNDPLGNLDPELTESINHRAAVRVAKCAKAAGVARFLFASTCSVYGNAAEAMVDEEVIPRPLTPYARAKALVERDVAVMASPDFSPTFLRLSTVYGLSPRIRLDLVVNDLAGCAYTSGVIRLRSDGTAWRSLVHVEDVCHTFAAVLAAPRETVHAQVLNVAPSDESYRVRAIAQTVHETMPSAHVEFADGAGTDARSYRVSGTKLLRCLPDLKPQWTLRCGVQQVLQGYALAALDTGVFLGERYRRLDKVRSLRQQGRIDASLRPVAAPPG